MHAFGVDDIFNCLPSRHSVPGVDQFCQAQVVWFCKVLKKWLDLSLRSLKYVLLALFLAVVGYMSANALDGFMQTPYGFVVDVKMMNFFRDMSLTAAVVIAALAVMSMLVQNFWCRYLCPYGALLGLASLLCPVKIRRDKEACIDCGKCARACPAQLPVDQFVQIRSVECTACMACVAACSAQDALQFALPPRKGASSAARWHRHNSPCCSRSGASLHFLRRDSFGKSHQPLADQYTSFRLYAAGAARQ